MDASQSTSILHKGAPKVQIKRNPAIVLYLEGMKHASTQDKKFDVF